MIIWEVLALIVLIGLVALIFILPRRKRNEEERDTKDPQRHAKVEEQAHN